MEEQAAQSVKEQIEISAGVTSLGKMIGLQSTQRNLKTEDNLYKEDAKLHQRVLWEGEEGAESMSNLSTGNDEQMDILAARDVYVNQPPAPQEASPPEPPVPQPPPPKNVTYTETPVPSPQKMPGWQKALLGGALATILGGAGLTALATGLGIGYLLSDASPVLEADRYDIGLLPEEEN